MQIVDLYSGIGGFSLAGRWVGWRTIQFCEIDKFCQKVLSYHWPDVPIHDDINTLTVEQVKNNKLYDKDETTIIVGGFPCQPWSVAGKRKGTEDNRNLWPQTIAFIKVFKSDWVVLENVPGIITWDGGVVFNQIITELEDANYTVQTIVLPACGVNAPHRRDRVWIVGYNESNRQSQSQTINQGKKHKFQDRGTLRGIYPAVANCGITSNPINTGKGTFRNGINKDRKKENKERQQSQSESCRCGRDVTNTKSKRLERSKNKRIIEESKQDRNKQSSGFFCTDWQNFPTQSPLCSGNDGIPRELDFKTVFAGIPFPRKPITFSKWRNESIKCLGNSIVPQVVLQIFKVINKIENEY